MIGPILAMLLVVGACAKAPGTPAPTATPSPVEDPSDPPVEPDPDPDPPVSGPKPTPAPPGVTPPAPSPAPRPTWQPLPKFTPYPYQPYQPTPPPGLPPDQPTDAAKFIGRLSDFGYPGTGAQARDRVRKLIATPQTGRWSAVTLKTLPAKFAKYRGYFDQPPASVEEYSSRARALALDPRADFFIRTDISFKKGADLQVVKGRIGSREIVAFNQKGEMTAYLQFRQLTLLSAIWIPPSVYRP